MRLWRILLDGDGDGGGGGGTEPPAPAPAAPRPADPMALLSGQVGALTSDRDHWRKKHDEIAARLAGQPSTEAAEVKRLRAQIRERDHRDAFRGVAGELGVRPDAVDALWKLSGYDPGEADAPDAAALAALVEDGRERYPYLYGAAPAPAAADPGPAPAAPAGGLGTGRGKGHPPGKLRVTKEQMADPLWCHANQAAVKEARKAGTLLILG